MEKKSIKLQFFISLLFLGVIFSFLPSNASADYAATATATSIFNSSVWALSANGCYNAIIWTGTEFKCICGDSKCNGHYYPSGPVGFWGGSYVGGYASTVNFPGAINVNIPAPGGIVNNRYVAPVNAEQLCMNWGGYIVCSNIYPTTQPVIDYIRQYDPSFSGYVQPLFNVDSTGLLRTGNVYIATSYSTIASTNSLVIGGLFPDIKNITYSCPSGGTLSGTTCITDCNLPWGGTIASGNSTTAFSATSVPCGSVCTSISQTRTCTNGTLSGSYSNQSCTPAVCLSCSASTASWLASASCSGPYNLITSGRTRTIISHNGNIGHVTLSCNNGTVFQSSATCTVPNINATCGTASKIFSSTDTSWGSYTACATGTAALPSFPATGASSSWTCIGSGTGTNASCAASRTSLGTCGTANGVSTSIVPTSNFCVSSIPSAVTTNFSNYTWNCVGDTTASCSAPRTGQSCTSPCGLSDSLSGTWGGFCYLTSSVACGSTCALSQGYCNSGTWTMPYSAGYAEGSCMMQACPVNGSCGPEDGTFSMSVPTVFTCDIGTKSALSPSDPWQWTCPGTNGGIDATCQINKSIDGKCGIANGTTISSIPSNSEACDFGFPVGLSGTGPWSWTCSGIGTGSSPSPPCSAYKAPTVTGVDWREVAP